MATKIWTGKLQPLKQMDTITPSGAVNGTTYSIRSGSSVASYTAASGDTLADVINGIIADAGEVGREFQDITLTNESDTTLQAESAVAGVPYDLQNENECPVVNDQSATGPNHWAAGNFEGGLPTTSDTVIFQHSSHSLLYGLSTGVTGVHIVVDASFTGRIGLLKNNDNGYVEYRDRALELAPASVIIGRGSGTGSDFIYIDGGATATNVRIYSTGAANTETNAVALRNYANGTVNIEGGSLSIGPYDDASVTIADLRASGSATIDSGALASVTALQVSGSATVTLDKVTGNIVMESGTVVVNGSTNGSDVTMRGGTLTWNSSGNLENVTLDADDALLTTGDLLDAAITITELFANAGTFQDPNRRCTIAAFTIGATEISLAN